MSEQLAISALIAEADDYSTDDAYLSNLLSRLARAVESMSAAIVAKNLELGGIGTQEGLGAILAQAMVNTIDAQLDEIKRLRQENKDLRSQRDSARFEAEYGGPGSQRVEKFRRGFHRYLRQRGIEK